MGGRRRDRSHVCTLYVLVALQDGLIFRVYHVRGVDVFLSWIETTLKYATTADVRTHFLLCWGGGSYIGFDNFFFFYYSFGLFFYK